VTLPRFTPAPMPTEPSWPRGDRIDWARAPACYCGAVGPLDTETLLCRDCFRVCVLARAWEFRIALESEK
jgi:hypothetical protein